MEGSTSALARRKTRWGRDGMVSSIWRIRWVARAMEPEPYIADADHLLPLPLNRLCDTDGDLPRVPSTGSYITALSILHKLGNL